MKYLLLILGSLAIFANAELPSNIPDQKVRDSVEYIDGKANKAFNITRKFESATSTVTVSGFIDIGLVNRVYSTVGFNSYRAGCGNSYRVLGGGCITSAQISNSFPSTETNSADVNGTPVPDGGIAYSWSCNSTGTGAQGAYAICARIK